MNIGNKSIEKLVNLLSKSPQIKDLADQEIDRKIAEATEGRRKCLHKLNEASKNLEVAAGRLADAKRKMEAMREEIRLMENAALSEISFAENDFLAAQKIYSQSNSDLVKYHGEDVIRSALLTLHSMKTQEEQRLLGFKNNLYEKMAWGTVRTRPEVKLKIENISDNIALIDRSADEINKLLLSEYPPHVINDSVSKILNRHAVKLNSNIEKASSTDFL